LWISGVVRAKSISGEHYAKAHFLAIGWDEIPPSSTDATAWKIDSERKKDKKVSEKFGHSKQKEYLCIRK
jgi:hypothetical protein